MRSHRADLDMKEGDQFRQLVKAMRAAQKQYFKERIPANLEKAKRLERQVDAWLDTQMEFDLT